MSDGPLRIRSDSRPEPLADAALALVLVAGLLVARVLEGDATSVGHLLTAGAAASLALRRRWPLVVFAATLAAAVVVIANDDASAAISLPVVVMVYTIALGASHRRGAAVAAVAALVLMLDRGVYQNHGWSDARTVAEPVIVLAALFLAWAVANHRSYVAQIESRALEAERTREDEARRRVAAERLRIARELHDSVAHSIATITVQAGAAAHVIDEHPDRAAEALRTIRATSGEALRELRMILGVLRQAGDSDGPAAAPGLAQLEPLVAASNAAGVPTAVTVTGERRALPATVDVAAYRIVQESLTNVLRHARGAGASVSIAYEPAMLRILVEDEGGPAGGAAQPGAGYGIVGMTERAQALGGALEAGPAPGGGFRVQARLPTPVAP